MRYQYKYVPLRTGGGFWCNNAERGHCEIIDRYAEEGWRYAGFVPTEFSSYGGIKALDLVFEKPMEE